MNRISIYDMDGTIVCSLHRYRTTAENKIDLAHWRENQHKAMDDSLLPMSAQYRMDLADPRCYVIIATARVMNEPDYRFVREVLGQPDYIISRAEGDATSGGALKMRGLCKILNLKQFRGVETVFYEDNATYLKTVCDYFNCRGVYVPSKQGH